jgi:hypothetical protein
MNLAAGSRILKPGKVNSMAVLKTRTHNERAEIAFELEYLTSLTTQERFEMMFRKSREMASLRRRHGNRRTTQIVKRT